jgi:hypothetical protein
MRHTPVWLLLLILFSSVFFAFETPRIPSKNNDEPKAVAQEISELPIPDSAECLYQALELSEKGLAFSTFENAYHGFYKLGHEVQLQKQILSIVDMSQPSCQKRLYIIDMAAKKLLVHTLVAHGKNSGEFKATKFSNTNSSLQSSLGFYVTGGTYLGSNGYSMRLKGMEKGFNDQAENRAIVMHGAPYVNEDIAKRTGRIGRSWGCPAVSVKEHKMIIDLVKNGSCLFVFAPEKKYLTASSFTKSDRRSL